MPLVQDLEKESKPVKFKVPDNFTLRVMEKGHFHVLKFYLYNPRASI